MTKELFIVHHDGGWAVKPPDAERSRRTTFWLSRLGRKDMGQHTS